MSESTQSPLVTTTDGGGLRPTFEELCQNTQLLIRFRWAAGLSIILGTLFARWVLDIDLLALPLLVIGVVVLAYNALLSRFVCRPDDQSLERVQKAAWGQIVLDWLAMIALVHFTGGITSPALIYFVIHTALSGTVLVPWQTRSLTALAILIVGGLAVLQSTGTLPHIRIDDLGLSNDLYKNETYIAAVMFFYGSTVITLSELVTNRAQRLRIRENRIRELYEARSTFVRIATHELRAPLAAGLSLVRNIEQGYAGELTSQQAMMMGRVASRLEGLRTLIDDLLTLAVSREASTAHAPLHPDSIRNTLVKLIERETPSIDRKQIKVVCDLADDPGIVLAGNVGLGIIFGNLLNNAVKYTPEGGQVDVHYGVNRLTQKAEIVIKDSGMGIPAEDLPNIFNEFFRARNAKAAQISGTGIGLSTVRTLVERYNGTITLQSEEGQGTTVRVLLPLAPRQSLGDGDD